MKALFRGVNRTDVLCNIPFVLMWVALAVGDLMREDWLTAVVHFWTGIIVAAFVLRVQLSYRRLHDVQADYRRAVEALKTATPPLDIDQMRQHLMN